MRTLIFILSLIAVINPLKLNIQVPGEISQGEGERYVYIGAEACASKCHNSEDLGHQYDSWLSSRHSKSYNSLLTEKARIYAREAGPGINPLESMICIKCHVTAADCDSTSIGPTYRKEDGVTCEACHKAEFNPKTYVPAEDDCLKCHNGSVHKVRPFDFVEACLKISHPRPKAKQKHIP